MRIGIVGASGFVGQALVSHVTLHGHKTVSFVRQGCGAPHEIVVGNIAFRGASIPEGVALDTIVHLVAKTHSKRAGNDEITEYRRVNVLGLHWTIELARLSGAKKIVYLSSVKVNGEETQAGKPFTELDVPRPEDSYGITKLEAENLLFESAALSGIGAISLRPPLVYGLGAKGNFPLLAKLAASELPIPFAAVSNRRSIIHVDNLCSAILACATASDLPNGAYLVSDSSAYSTPDLIRMLAAAQRKRARLFPVSPWLLSGIFNSLGKKELSQRLIRSLELDDTLIRDRLNWVPPYTTVEAFEHTFRKFTTG